MARKSEPVKYIHKQVQEEKKTHLPTQPTKQNKTKNNSPKNPQNPKQPTPQTQNNPKQKKKPTLEFTQQIKYLKI